MPEPRLFSIGTIVVLKSIWLDQHVKLITLVGLNIVEHVIVPIELVSKLHVSFDILIKLVSILPIKIAIPPILSNNIYQIRFSNMK